MNDWESSSTEILLNPAATRELQEGSEKLSLIPGFPRHVWLATSGSVNGPKWVALSKQAILNSAKAVNDNLHSTARDIWLNSLPAFHVGGLGIWARSFLSGATVIETKMLKWNPHQFVQLISETQATLSSLVPAQVYDLVSQKLQSPTTLRATLVGGGFLNTSLYQDAKLLGWPLLPCYGMTETASQIATANFDHPSLKILPHAEVKINAEGLICIKSSSLFSAYAIPSQGKRGQPNNLAS